MIEDGAVHVLDGAIGTLLYERGVFVNVCYDELSMSEPELVAGIHREYVEAGAEVVETNTFGANPVKLSGFGLDEKTEVINRAAAALARGAAAGRALVIGAIGPLGIRIEPWGPTSGDEAEGYFERQATGLLEGGVDGFLLETFSDLSEMGHAIRACRAVSDLPLFAQVTIEEGGSTSYGTDVETVASTLDEWGADVIGVNCSVGPAEILDAIERMAAVTDRPLVAQPNAGLPRLVGDRKIYLASPAYMARYAVRMVEAGARFVGGCCGTTPEHIRQIRSAVREEGRPDERGARDQAAGREPYHGAVPPIEAKVSATTFFEPDDERAAVPLAERSGLGARLHAGEFVISLELVPPSGWDSAPLLADARKAMEAGVDVVTVADSGRGPRRMGAIPAGIILSRECEIDVVVQYPCRDRNMPRMISDLLGAAAAGIRNVLVVTGEPTPTGPYPDHTEVFDIDSIGLTNLLDHLNRGVDPGGQRVEPPTRFVTGVVLNPGSADPERELDRYRWKLKAGADYSVTRPVFDADALEKFLARVESERRVPVLAGVSPIGSLRDGEYLSQEAPGIWVPPVVLERMESAESAGGDAGRREGRRIVTEMLEAVLPSVQGIHVIPSRSGLEPALEVVRDARQLRSRTDGG